MATLKFGTSGLRGLASELEGPETARHVAAFVAAMRGRGLARPGTEMLVARDLRASSPAIARLCVGAIAGCGLRPVDCGEAPTPALALAAMTRRVPAVMVTGSHIPEDRNGMKFYRPDGEIDKADEAAILAALGEAGQGAAEARAADIVAPYERRYLDFFAAGALSGLRLGVHQHSSVSRDLVAALLRQLGATVVELGRADHFVAIDTEAVSDVFAAATRRWARELALDAIVSTDGDGDRPLMADETGEFLPGDLVGAITAAELGAEGVATPVTSNSALERSGRFGRVLRTRIGSPHVIAAMGELANEGAQVIVGFEANGGVLLGSDVAIGSRMLARLPTRDAVLPILAVLAARTKSVRSLGDFAASFGFRPACAGKLDRIDEPAAGRFLERLASDAGFRSALFAGVGKAGAVDLTDGVRFSFANGDILHYRRSGNAPELRCYVEAGEPARAAALLARGLDLARGQLAGEAVA